MEDKQKRRIPSWDETFMEMATVIARRSKCVYYQVGAVFARGKQFLQVGFNGPTKNKDGINNHCCEIGCAKTIDGVMIPPGSGMCRGAHAEMNGIVNADSEGVSLRDSDVYCTFSPCFDCSKHLVNLRIKRFIYLYRYEKEYPQVRKIFKDNGIYLHQAVFDENGFRLLGEEKDNE